MNIRNIFKRLEEKIISEKKTIPESNQKQMMEFFMRTSIPRKKTNSECKTTEKGKGRLVKLKQPFMSGYQQKNKEKRVFQSEPNKKNSEITLKLKIGSYITFILILEFLVRILLPVLL